MEENRQKENITICFFGFYDPNYSRSRVLLKGFHENNISVIECRSNKTGVAKYINLVKRHWKIRKDYDILFVAYPGYMATILAKFITRKKIVYDAFFSIYDSVVNDRETVKKISLKAMYYWCIDWIACTFAGKIILDTNANINYFVETFGIKKNKFIRLFVGSDNSVMFPEENNKVRPFTVHFHGGFNPMQGVKYVIKAAHILKHKSVFFRIVGRGQEYKRVMGLVGKLGVENIEFVAEIVSYERLRDYLNDSDVCLGIFSDNAKARRVIPNKVYEGLACKKPVITQGSPAINELLENEENVLLCKGADPQDLAKKILTIKKNREFGLRIAGNGYNLFVRELTPKTLVFKLMGELK